MKALFLFASFLPLLINGLQAQAPAPATVAPSSSASAKWEGEIAAFEEQDRAYPPAKGAILFIGSSSIRLWLEVAQDFPQHRVLNRGFGGSLASDSVAFIGRIVLPYAPRMIFFYAGTNDINAHKSPQAVADAFREFATKVHAVLPETEIAFISIAPNPSRWPQVEQVKIANGLVESFCRQTPHLKYVDVFNLMLGPDGQPKEGIYRADQLHMNREGYKIWIKALQPCLPPPDLVVPQQ